jgi:hypothetical protein
LAVAVVLAATAAARAQQVCPFLMRQQFQLQVQMQQQLMMQRTIASRFQQPVFQQRQDLTPRLFSQPVGRAFTPHAPRFQVERRDFVRPVTRTIEGTRTQVHRTSWRIEEVLHPRGHGPGHYWRRVREGSAVHTTVSHFRRQETHLQRFTQERLTVKLPSVTARKQEPPRFLQTIPRDRVTVGKRGGEEKRTERTPIDTHRPLVQLRVRTTTSCGTCHSQPPAPTVVSRPANPLPLPAGKPAAPSVVMGRGAPAFAVPGRQPGLVVGLPRQPLFLATLPPDLLPAVMRPAAPRLPLLAPPVLPGLLQGLARPALGLATRAPGASPPGETETASPGSTLSDKDLLRGAPPLPPLEGGVALAVPASTGAGRPAEKVAAALPLLPADVAQAPPLPPLPGRSPLLIAAVPADAGAPPAGLLLADLIALAPALPPLPDEPPAEATQRE